MDRNIAITINLDSDFLISLKKTKDEFEKDVKFLIALSLYNKRRISLGKAAKLAGFDKITFINKLQMEGETIFDYSNEEINQIIEDTEKLKFLK